MGIEERQRGAVERDGVSERGAVQQSHFSSSCARDPTDRGGVVRCVLQLVLFSSSYDISDHRTYHSLVFLHLQVRIFNK